MIFAENFFFCCEKSIVKRGETPTGGPRPTLPNPVINASREIKVFFSTCVLCKPIGFSPPGRWAASQ